MMKRAGLLGAVAAAAIAAGAGIGCNRGGVRDETPPVTTRGVDAGAGKSGGRCPGLPSAEDLRRLLKQAPSLVEAGGLAHGRNMWAAVVNREGELCVTVVSTDDPAAAWPGSQAIARAKAYTANAFSTDTVPLSTARLYTLSQPGHSLWGAGAANGFNPLCMTTPKEHDKADGKLCGGTIVFGGGLPLYKGQTRIGGLGVSGDTACADHEIAKTVRDRGGMNPPSGPAADDITYSGVDGASVFTHPLCVNTWRNGKKIGEEPPAAGY
ncbi:MAG: heme-binding protein [Acidobacteria bacterium]|nr:heme-binding protein [Acidobacteriota bacterium]MCA1610201.1 heme-binding protein [Acidobacteriota bacterium]